MSSMDQSHEPNAKMYEVLRDIGLQGRIRMTFDLIQSLRQIVQDGVRARHPEYSDRQVHLAATKLAIGAELFKRVYPGEDVEP